MIRHGASLLRNSYVQSWARLFEPLLSTLVQIGRREGSLPGADTLASDPVLSGVACIGCVFTDLSDIVGGFGSSFDISEGLHISFRWFLSIDQRGAGFKN